MNENQVFPWPPKEELILLFQTMVELVNYRVLRKSNAREMREFRFLFSRTFNEISCEISNDNSRLFERIWKIWILSLTREVWIVRKKIRKPTLQVRESSLAAFAVFAPLFFQLLSNLRARRLVISTHLLVYESFSYIRQLFRSPRAR